MVPSKLMTGLVDLDTIVNTYFRLPRLVVDDNEDGSVQRCQIKHIDQLKHNKIYVLFSLSPVQNNLAMCKHLKV